MRVGIGNKGVKLKKKRLKWEELSWTDDDKVEWIKDNSVLNHSKVLKVFF